MSDMAARGLRLGIGDDVLRGMEVFSLRRPSKGEEDDYEAAAKAIDRALAETMKYLRDEAAGKKPKTSADSLADLWLRASQKTERFDPELAAACHYKAMGWIEPEYWDR